VARLYFHSNPPETSRDVAFPPETQQDAAKGERGERGLNGTSEADKDRVAEVSRRLFKAYCDGDPLLWKGGEPEKRLSEEYDRLLTREEQAFALVLSAQYIAHLDESGPDPILGAIDEAQSRGEGSVEREED
jgi:hypothetical protein